MNNKHTIRLHGPWQATILETFEADTPASKVSFLANSHQADGSTHRRVKIPSDWSAWPGEGFLGRVQYIRKFNRPTGLEQGQKVTLVVEQVDQHGKVFLNDEYLGDVSWSHAFEAEIQEQLQNFNHLRVEVSKQDPHSGAALSSCTNDQRELGGGLVGSVRLEIEE